MKVIRRFRFWLTILLAFPGVLYFVGSSPAPSSVVPHYFVANYLFMAAPHIAVAAFAISPKRRRLGLLLALVALNLLLLGFFCWVQLAVPVHESGLAWVLYLPLAGIALALLGIIAIVLHRWRDGGTVGA